MKFLSEWEVLINLSLLIMLIVVSWVGATHELKKMKNAILRVLDNPDNGTGIEDAVNHVKWILLYLLLDTVGGVTFLVYALHI